MRRERGEVNLARKGYCLVGCTLGGVDAFFVGRGHVADKFHEPFSAENHNEPARLHLNGITAGPAASYKTLSKALTMHRG